MPLFNSSIWLLNRLLSVLDRTVNDDREREENISSVCSAAAVLITVKIKVWHAKQKNVSADVNIWKMPIIRWYFGLGTTNTTPHPVCSGETMMSRCSRKPGSELNKVCGSHKLNVLSTA